jgi:hypothetical protein
MERFLSFQVKEPLRHYPDLVNGLNEFLDHCENIGGSHITFLWMKLYWIYFCDFAFEYIVFSNL